MLNDNDLVPELLLPSMYRSNYVNYSLAWRLAAETNTAPLVMGLPQLRPMDFYHLTLTDELKEFWTRLHRGVNFTKVFFSNLDMDTYNALNDPVTQLSFFEFMEPIWYMKDRTYYQRMDDLFNTIDCNPAIPVNADQITDKLLELNNRISERLTCELGMGTKYTILEIRERGILYVPRVPRKYPIF